MMKVSKAQSAWLRWRRCRLGFLDLLFLDFASSVIHCSLWIGVSMLLADLALFEDELLARLLHGRLI
jgi:hypothetical protein